MPSRPPPEPGAGQPLLQSMRELGSACRGFQDREIAANRRVASLERQVVRYIHERDARTTLVQERDRRIEDLTGRVDAAERSLRDAVQEAARLRQEVATHKGRADHLEEVLAELRRTGVHGATPGIGVCEAILDANQTLVNWCSAI